MNTDIDWDFFPEIPPGPALIHGAAHFTQLEWVEEVYTVCRGGRPLPAITHRYRVTGHGVRCGCNAKHHVCTKH